MVRQRVRIRFAKQGDLRLISHRDLMRTWERLFRRAGVPLCMTEGFHPKPKMMFPSALAVGIEGLDEVLEVELPAEYEPERLATAIRSQTPPGLIVHGVEPLRQTGGKTRLHGMSFTVEVPLEQQGAVAARVDWLMQQTSCTVVREGRAAPLDLRRFIVALQLDEGTLHMRLGVDGDGAARPREVLSALGLTDIEAQGVVLRRTGLELVN
jgi:radical SAM-linked protein